MSAEEKINLMDEMGEWLDIYKKEITESVIGKIALMMVDLIDCDGCPFNEKCEPYGHKCSHLFGEYFKEHITDYTVRESVQGDNGYNQDGDE